MIPTDTDRAYQQHFDQQLFGQQRFDLRHDDGHLHLLRASTRNRDGHSPRKRRLDHAVGSIQIVRPLCGASGDTNGVPMADDGLSAARGLIVGAAMGAVFWAMIGGLISLLFF